MIHLYQRPSRIWQTWIALPAGSRRCTAWAGPRGQKEPVVANAMLASKSPSPEAYEVAPLSLT